VTDPASQLPNDTYHDLRPYDVAEHVESRRADHTHSAVPSTYASQAAFAMTIMEAGEPPL
jgi:hypothetical protein